MFLKCQSINLDVLFIFVKKTVHILYLKVVLESLQSLLTDIWAGNAPTGNSPPNPR